MTNTELYDEPLCSKCNEYLDLDPIFDDPIIQASVYRIKCECGTVMHLRAHVTTVWEVIPPITKGTP
jgi:hypothetical protein